MPFPQASVGESPGVIWNLSLEKSARVLLIKAPVNKNTWQPGCHPPPAALRLSFQPPATFELFELVDGAATWARGAELALFDLEGQHVEQAGDPIVERLEQGLFLQRRNVEVKAQEIDQVGIAQSLLFDQSAPGCVGIFAQKP